LSGPHEKVVQAQAANRESDAKSVPDAPSWGFRGRIVTQFEYKGFRMTAEETAGGWRIEIVRREGGQARETATYDDLSEAIDEAKNIVDRPH